MLYRAYERAMNVASIVYREGYRRLRVNPILNGISRESVILEIGGAYNPYFTKDRYPRTYHLDHCSREELRHKYRDDPLVKHRLDAIQPVDFVSDGFDLEAAIPPHLKFDVIFSSHALEHQIDLLGHLRSLEKLLAPRGSAIMMIPDRRSCLDALRFPTVLSDVIMAHRRPGRTHRGKQIFDCAAQTLDLNPGRRLRRPDLARARFLRPLAMAVAWLEESEAPEAVYRDVHAWVFCPESFELMMIELRLLRLTGLEPTFVSRSHGNEFCVVLERAPEHGEGAETHARLERRRLALTKRLHR